MLQKHKESIHEGIRYSCYICYYKATTLSSLTQHKKSIHDGIRYSCNICDCKATQLGNLMSHKNQFMKLSDILAIFVIIRHFCLRYHKKLIRENVRYSCDFL